MSLPAPEAGLVIRYSYLWTDEHRQGREEGVKDRPCAIILAMADEAGEQRVIVVPITHARPRDLADAIELPPATKRRLGLDDDQSWIVITEANRFLWPGPDLRPRAGAGAESVALGFLPPSLLRQVRERFLALAKSQRANVVTRT